MKIYQLIAQMDILDYEDVVIGTFKNEDDALNALADWTENCRALNEALEACKTEEDADTIMSSVPNMYHCEMPVIKEFEVLDKYDSSLTKM